MQQALTGADAPNGASLSSDSSAACRVPRTRPNWNLALAELI